MRMLRFVCAVSLLFSTSGCLLTARVARLSEKTRSGGPEVLTATTTGPGPDGAPFAVVALEAVCRVTPRDPEGGPGARGYVLRRRSEPAPDETRLLDSRQLSCVGSYGAFPRGEAADDPERSVPEGFPDRVLLGQEPSGSARLFLGGPGGWRETGVDRYVHAERSEGHPVLAGLELGLLMLPAAVVDAATFPIQWLFVAPYFPVTPP